MAEDQGTRPHSVPRSVALHLVPGILIGVFYFAVRVPLARAGYPSVLALMLAIPLVLVPLELGWLLLQGRRRTGRLSIASVVSFRARIPAWHYVAWSLGTFVVVGLIFAAMRPVDTFLKEAVFSWVPTLETGLDGGFDRTPLVVTYLAVLIFGAILGPVVEELYFRGYLLPRTPGRFSILRHSLMFAAYHVFTPWMIVTRTVGLLPLIFAVRKSNIYVGIIVHVLINSIDVVMGFAFIAGM